MVDALRKFVESRVPFLEHVFAVWNESDDKNQRNSAKYCFKQAFFYAAVHFMEWSPYLSVAAADEVKERSLSHHLPSARWDDQPRFDPGREIFHFEHVFTGEMCWNLIEPRRGHIRADDIEAMLRDNYAVAWILKAEDGRLPRSIRGVTLQDALAVYKQHNIQLVR